MATTNTPTAQGWSYDFVSTLEPLLEAYAIGETIYRAYGDQKYNAYMMIKELGWQKEVDQQQFHHFEQNRLNQNVLIETTATATGPGAALVVDIDPTEFVNGKTYARPNWTITFLDYKKAWIKSVDTSLQQMTLIPFDSTYTISVTAGQAYAIGASAWGEGTGQPIGEIQGYVKRNGWVQILKDNATATGTAMTDRAFPNVKQLAAYIADAPPELGNTLVAMCQAQIDYSMAVQFSDLIYWGEENNNASLIVSPDALALGGGVKSTKGLNQVTNSLGSTINYPLTTLSLGDFYDITNILDREMVDPNFPIIHRMGRGQYIEREKMFAANGAINFQAKYTRDDINKKIFDKKAGKEVFFNYTNLTIGEYTFLASTEPTFTDNKGMGTANYSTPNLGFLIPTTGGTDRDGNTLDAICMRYKKLGSYNRMMEAWSTDWHQNNYDVKAWQMRSNVGVEFFGANRFIKLQGQ